MTGKIFKIEDYTKTYIGQTSCDADDLYYDICSDDENNIDFVESQMTILEDDIPIEDLDKKYISHLPFKPYIYIPERALIVKNIETLAETAKELLHWDILKDLQKAVQNYTTFLGYHFIELYINMPINCSRSILEDWIKTLGKKFEGKHIYCDELDKHYRAEIDCLVDMVKNQLIPSNITLKEFKKKIKQKEKIDEKYTVRYLPKALPYDKFTNIYCKELDMIFADLDEAVYYCLQHKIFYKLNAKTIKDGIYNNLKGYYLEFQNYHFASWRIEDIV